MGSPGRSSFFFLSSAPAVAALPGALVDPGRRDPVFIWWRSLVDSFSVRPIPRANAKEEERRLTGVFSVRRSHLGRKDIGSR